MKKNSTNISKAASLFTIAVGCLVLAGWFFNIPFFKSILPGIVSIKFNTAICFILSGIALYLLNVPARSQSRKTITSVCSWIVLLTGILTLSQYIFGYNLGIDELLWKEGPEAIATSFPGRMSLSTSLNFTLLGFIFLMLGKRKYHWPIQVLLIAMIPGSMLVIFNHLFGVSFLNSIPQLNTTALLTAILFIVLCLGVFFSSALGYLRFSFMKKIAGFFVLIFLVRSIIFFAINKNNELTADTDKWLEHTHEVFLMAEKVNTQSNEIQSGARGYIITGEENYPPFFNNTADSIGNIIGRLRILTKENAGQQLRIDALQKHLDTYITSLKELVNIRRNEGFEAAQKIMLNDQGKLLLNGVHSIVTAIEQEENQNLAKRKAESELSIQNSSRLFTIFQVIAVLLMLAALKIIYNNIRLRNKIEEALQKSLKETSDYIYALDESSIVAITDQKGIIKQVNNNFCKISKYKREELIGQDHRIINSGYHPEEFMRDLWVTIANGKVWRGDLKNKAKDGTFYWVDTTIVPFLNEQGKPYQYVGIRSDITQQKALEDEIKQFNQELQKRVEDKTKEVIEKEQQYRFLLQNMQEGIQVIGYDWKYLFANNSVVEKNKYSNEELLGYTIMEKHSGIENTELFKVLQRCMKERSPEIFEHECTFPVGTKGWFEMSIQPVPEGLFILSMDITERKKAEETIKAYGQQLGLIYNTTKDIIFLISVADYRYCFTSVNESFLAATGLKEEQVVGKLVNEIIPEPSLSTVLDNFRQAILKRQTVQWEETSNYYAGRKVGVATITPVFNEQGQCKMLVGGVHDITERRKAKEEIERMNKMLEKRAAELQASNTELEHFAYIASHDLQEPLRMVTSFMNLLEKRMDGQLDETNKQYIYFAVDGAERMRNLIQALLEYSRVGTNKEDFIATDLNEVMQYTTRVLEENFKNNRATITVKPMPVIMANKTLIGQLFVNLINNALKYHGDKEPEIEAGCTEKPGKYIFYVKDNGIGIDPKFFDKIFIIFQRLHNKSEYSGTGIGLAICKKIVEIHNGKIWVESEAGKGCTFYFSIPKQNV